MGGECDQNLVGREGRGGEMRDGKVIIAKLFSVPKRLQTVLYTLLKVGGECKEFFFTKIYVGGSPLAGQGTRTKAKHFFGELILLRKGWGPVHGR